MQNVGRSAKIALFNMICLVLHRHYKKTFEPWEVQNEKFHDLCSTPNTTCIIQSSRMRRTDHVTRTGEKRNAYRVLMWKPAGGRYKHRWDNTIRDIQGTEWGSMD
jgi:hypothetical protein